MKYRLADPENKDGTAEVEGDTVDVATMTDTSDIAKLQEVCQLWREENSLLKAFLGPSLAKESLQNDDAKVKFYTGLQSFATLTAIFRYVSAPLMSGPWTILATFQQFLMLLIKASTPPSCSRQHTDLVYISQPSHETLENGLT